jgi:hypothetical protein
MKNPKSNPFLKVFSAVVCCLSGMSVHAGIIQKADNAADLNLNGIWSGGTVLGSSSAAPFGGLIFFLGLVKRRRKLVL